MGNEDDDECLKRFKEQAPKTKSTKRDSHKQSTADQERAAKKAEKNVKEVE